MKKVASYGPEITIVNVESLQVYKHLCVQKDLLKKGAQKDPDQMLTHLWFRPYSKLSLIVWRSPSPASNYRKGTIRGEVWGESLVSPEGQPRLSGDVRSELIQSELLLIIWAAQTNI